MQEHSLKQNRMDNKKKTWEFDEAREPLILISITWGCHNLLDAQEPTNEGPVQHGHHRDGQGPQECESLAQQREIGPDGRRGRAKSLVGTAADILRGVLIRNNLWSKENGRVAPAKPPMHKITVGLEQQHKRWNWEDATSLPDENLRETPHEDEWVQGYKRNDRHNIYTGTSDPGEWDCLEADRKGATLSHSNSTMLNNSRSLSSVV